VHDAAGGGIEGLAAMHGATVVPQHEVADPPGLVPGKGILRRMRPESVEKYTVGTEVYGHIEDATSKAGKPYNRFKTDKREDYNQAPAAPQTSASHATQQAKSTDDYWSDKDKAIRAQWAIGQAKDWALGNDMDFDEIEVVANEFFGMVQRVKGGLSVTDVKKAIPDVVVEPEDGPITYEDIPDFA